MALSLRIPIVAVIFLAAVMTEAQTPPSDDCSTVVMSMADCLSFVTAGSTAQKPEGACCAGLKSVIATNPKCLCEGFKNSAKMGIQLDMQKALSLPAVCHVTAPPLNDCGINVPAGSGSAPAVPAAVSPATPVTNTSSTGAHHEAAPAPPKSGSSALASSVVLTVVAAVSSALF